MGSAPHCTLDPSPAAPAPVPPPPSAVTASQVPGGGGALALYLLPRCLLVNTLEVPIQYKQQVCGWLLGGGRWAGRAL